jgi:hypothetical protein
MKLRALVRDRESIERFLLKPTRQVELFDLATGCAASAENGRPSCPHTTAQEKGAHIFMAPLSAA